MTAPAPAPLSAGNDPRRLDIDDKLTSLVIRGANVRGDVAEAVSTGTVSLAADAVTQVRLDLADPDFALARTNLFVRGANVDYQDLQLVIASYELGPGTAGTGAVTIEARSAVVSDLKKKRRGPLVMRNVSPTQFVEAEARAVGARVVAQPSATRAQVSRDVVVAGETPPTGAEYPSSWTTFLRLAKELGYYVFEYAGVVFFGQPTWLIDHNPPDLTCGWFGVEEGYKTLTIPVCRASDDAENVVEIELELPPNRALDARPGRALRLIGMPGFTGRYMIKNVDFPLAGGGSVRVNAVTPVNPRPEGEAGAVVEPVGGTALEGQGKYKIVVDAAIAAGFKGESLITAVAIAIAESGGDPKAVNRANRNGSVDYGLWQINSVHTKSGFDPKQAFDPNYNARWAYRISKNGTDFGPWSVFWKKPFTSGKGQGKFLEFRDEATGAIRFNGGSGSAAPTGATGTGSALDFVTICLSQAGDQYVYAAEADPRNPNPRAFDCSELIEWALARTGIRFPDGSKNQFAHCRAKGTLTSIDDAVKTRGALLFKMTGNPTHVAVSLGDGRTIEARGRAYGVGSFSAIQGRAWTHGGRVPGLKY